MSESNARLQQASRAAGSTRLKIMVDAKARALARVRAADRIPPNLHAHPFAGLPPAARPFRLCREAISSPQLLLRIARNEKYGDVPDLRPIIQDYADTRREILEFLLRCRELNLALQP
jgi:hypothetical protein